MVTPPHEPLATRRAAELAQAAARVRRLTTGFARARENVESLEQLGSPQALLEQGARRLGLGTEFTRVLVSRLWDHSMTVVSVWDANGDRRLPGSELTVALAYPLVEAELARSPGARSVEVASAGGRTPAPLREALGWTGYVVATITLAGAPVGLIHAEPADRPPETVDLDIVSLLAGGFSAAYEVASLRAALAGHRDLQRATSRQLSVVLTDEEVDRPAGDPIGGPPELEPLTGREQEVLELLARGLTNRAIGAEAMISEATVKYHVRNVLRKLGATSRAEAVARHLARRTGADGR